MKIKGIKIFILVGIISIVLTACSYKKEVIENKTIISENILAKVIEQNEKIDTYYAEGILETYDNNKKNTSFEIKEWKSFNKMRHEAKEVDKIQNIVTYDGNRLVINFLNENEFMISKDADIKSFLDNPINFKDTLIDQFKIFSKTHSFENYGESKLNGYDVYHLVGKPDDSNSILGEVEYFICKDNWFILKTVSTSGNTKIVNEYKKVEFNKNLKEDLFVQKIPKDAEVIDLDEEVNESEKEVTFEEATEKLNQKILSYKEGRFKLDKVIYIDNDDEIGDEYNQIYLDEKGREAFTITAKKSINLDEEIKVTGEEEIKVRDKKGTSMDINDFKLIHWQEEGLNYSIFSTVVDISLEDLKNVAENLK